MSRRLAPTLLLLALLACVRGPRSPEPLNPVRFLLINDVYVADTLADGTGGLARVATVRSRLAELGPVLFVVAGDVLSPSLLSKHYRGRQMIEALNAAGLDYATFGNHEFELDRDTLLGRIAESEFTWISSNCTQADGTRFPKVLPWDTVRVSGHKVGLFGITLAGDYRRYVRCGNPDSVAGRVIDTLVAHGAELIVGLTHQTLAADRDLLLRESRLDLILGGHEHEAHDSVVAGRHVLKADANARSAQFVTLWGGRGAWRQAVGLVRIGPRLPEDSTVARVVRAWDDSLERRLGPERVIGSTEVPLDARDAVSRRAESPLGNLVTDAIRAGTGTDVALLNAGALRLDDVLPPGPLTNRQIESIFLFADETRVVTFPLTGARLRTLLEHGVSTESFGKGGFLQVSGVTYTFDPSRPSGDRLVGEIRRTGGGGIEPRDTVRVAFGAYPACEGGDGYQVPEAAAACRRREAGPRAADLLMRYIVDSMGGRVRQPAGPRIVEAETRTPDRREVSREQRR